MEKRILVVEDDPDIQQMVQDKLTHVGFKTWLASSGQEALSLIELYGLPHLALVDINLPGIDGIEFCEIVHKFSDLPCIMLTAVDDEKIVTESIEHFAEDYVLKPFRLSELVARIRRVLWRIKDFNYAQGSVIELDRRLAVNFYHQLVLIYGESTPLTPTETKLLYILLNNKGQIVTTDFLLRRLWPMDEVYEDTLRVHIHRLRHKIEDRPNGLLYIETVRGQGYRFIK